MTDSEPTLRRLRVLESHLTSVPVEGAVEGGVPLGTAAMSAPGGSLPEDPSDVVIVGAVRTAICKAKKGGFRETPPDLLCIAVLKGVLERTGVKPEDIGDIVFGNVLQPGAGAVMTRMAQLVAGIPFTVPAASVNRQCSSGLQAVMNVANGIKAGNYSCGIGVGVESMSINAMGKDAPDVSWDLVGDCKPASDCLVPMGITSENVAERYGVDRATQDAFSAESHVRAARAQATGKFDAEIVPVATKVTTDEGVKAIVVSKDDGIRGDTTAAGLAKLRPAFKPDGSTTAGNSSQVSDGAAAVMLMRRSHAAALGLPVLATVRSYAVAGVEPDEMGIGPAVAIPLAVAMAGVSLGDIDSFEINEAFASQAVYCVKKLGLPSEKVNPLGGAIALGHPLGCTGARQIVTLVHYLKERAKAAGGAKQLGVVSMCIGTGMGAAAVFEV